MLEGAENAPAEITAGIGKKLITKSPPGRHLALFRFCNELNLILQLWALGTETGWKSQQV
jgi:hypothetical protein